MTDDLETIRKKIRSVPTATQSGGEMSAGVKVLFTFVELFLLEKAKTFREKFNDGSLKFVELKDVISEAIYKELQPFQKKRKEIEADPKYVDRVIKEGAEKARAIASQTVKEVREKMGLL